MGIFKKGPNYWIDYYFRESEAKIQLDISRSSRPS